MSKIDAPPDPERQSGTPPLCARLRPPPSFSKPPAVPAIAATPESGTVVLCPLLEDIALGKHLNMLKRTKSKGGTSFWLTGPEGFDASILANRLRAKGVLIDRGQDYYLNYNEKRNFRLGFAYVPVSKLEDGVKIIAEEVRALL